MTTLPALALFALVASITPGPNNLMLLASGANFGFRRTLPHMLGISAGCTVMPLLIGLGLIQLFDAWPQSYVVLKWASVAYLLWLALKIATATPGAQPTDHRTAARPFGFLQAAAFQWVNPKAWTMMLTAITVHAPGRDLGAVVTVALCIGLVGLPCIALWAVLGEQIQRLLTRPARMRAFNLVMAALLVASLLPMLA